MSADAPMALSLFADDPPPTPAPAVSESVPAAGSSGALYRRYRSRDFGELVGQEPIVHTLRNALKAGRLAHAYLFCGPRGTGKTSTARLLAKAVNCLAEDPDARPCNACDACRSLNEGRAVDLIEIDAASNNSVEDVRDLRERVNFAPAYLRRKFYIIDEVHMMSTSAFNALLKTLEEPPAHTIFVLATTDPQKLPATVLSRCQRFDFRRIALPVMVSHMAGIVQTEGYTVEPGVLELIGRQATGCMRDALSLLDQLMSFADGLLTLAQVQAVLGARSTAEVGSFVDRLLTADVAGGLSQLHAAVENGADARQLNRQIVEYLRSLLLLRAGGNSAALDATDEEVAALREQAGRANLPALVTAIRAFSAADAGLKNGMYGLLPMELALVESTLAPSTTAEPARAPAAVPSAGAAPTRPMTVAEPRPASAPPVRERSTPPPTPVRKVAPVVTPAEPAVSTEPVPAGDADDLASVLSSWGRVIDALRPRDPRLQAFLRAGTPVAVDGGFVVLGFPPTHTLHRQTFEQPKNRDVVEAVMAEVLGRPYHLRCLAMSADDLTRAQAAPAGPPDGPEPAPPPTNARVQKARAIFEDD
ncbi:MAG TPA: DNA polymerase III subunit gamma/tau [Chloroflexia bacterium]|nr:DNA polymerase III subunit gamma/tau [Chloroflexia bacterium]